MLNTWTSVVFALLAFVLGCLLGFGGWVALHSTDPEAAPWLGWVLVLGSGIVGWALYYAVLFSISTWIP